MEDKLDQCGSKRPLKRRTALKIALGAALGMDSVPRALAQDARSMRPQPGDQLVFSDGDRVGKLITPDDVPIGGPQIHAFPRDPKSGLIRDGSRLNKVLLVRSEPSSLNEETGRRAAEGVCAYSAVCTHQGCEVMGWDAQMNALWCPCHDSKFDPKDSGRVVGGPAPKRLAALPLKLVDGAITVAAGFSGPVGFQAR